MPPFARPSFDLQPPSGLDSEGATSTPAVEHSPTLEREFHFARLRAQAGQSWESVRALAAAPLARGRAALGAAWGWARLRPWVGWGALAVALLAGGAWSALSIRHNRKPGEARALIAAGKLAEARDLLRDELAHYPDERPLRLLLGHVLHGMPGQGAAAIDAYAAAAALGPLDGEALANLLDDLGQDRATSDRASHLLVRIGEGALPAILDAAAQGAPLRRLRAMTLARDLGAEERVDRIQVYGGLLGESDCDVRKAAARRLGEIGDPAALPALRQAAKATREKKGFLGRVEREAACGADDARQAVARIEAVQGGGAP
jgi:serine/threonine-protein kinase